MKLFSAFLGTLTFSISIASSAVTTISFYNSDGFELRDYFSVPLNKGSLGSSDGDIIQVGYYSLSTTANPFAGSWVPLVQRTIGDKYEGSENPGRYSHMADFLQPSELIGIPLSLRFYDLTSLTGATYFNAVSDSSGSWNLRDSATGEVFMTLSLANSTLVWQDGTGSAFRTTIPIPEPAGLCVLAGLIFLRRSRSWSA